MKKKIEIENKIYDIEVGDYAEDICSHACKHFDLGDIQAPEPNECKLFEVSLMGYKRCQACIQAEVSHG